MKNHIVKTRLQTGEYLHVQSTLQFKKKFVKSSGRVAKSWYPFPGMIYM